MPAATFQGAYQASARNGSSAVVSVPNCAVGDTLVAFQVCDYMTSTAALVAPTTVAGVGAWTALTAGVKGGDVYSRGWRALVTTAGTRTVTMTRPAWGSGFNTVHVVRLSGVDPLQPIDGTPTTGGATTGSSLSIPAVTCETPDAILLACWGGLQYGGNLTITKPAAMTSLATASPRDPGQAYVASARQQLSAAGSTGTRVATSSPATSAGWTGIMVAISGVRYIPIDAGDDTGTGTDQATVDKTLVSNQSEPATATDPLVVDRYREPDTDQGLGSDTSYIDVLDPVWTNDQGVGFDPVIVALFKGNDLPEPGVGTDVIGMDRLKFLSTMDQGTGSDPSSLRQDKTPTDSGVGAETPFSLRMPGLIDSGLGSEDVRVLDIPYTQVLKRVGPPPVVYDLVCMARVPQPNGPPSFMEIEPIEWKSLSYTNELSTAQTLQATCQLSSVPENVLQRFRAPDELATEMWLLRNGKCVFAGPLVGLQTSGETLTINASGALAYLKVMFLTADYIKTGFDQATVVKYLVDQWQAQPYGNFGIDTSSITATGQTRDVEYKHDELPNVASKIEELGKAVNGFDIDVDPVTRKLQLWSPSKGQDRSTGEDAIVFDGRNVTSSDIVISVAVGDLASEAFGTASVTTTTTDSSDQQTLYSTKSNLDVRTRYGRTGVTSTFSDIKEQAALDDQVQALLDARASALAVPGPKVRVTPDADLPDYDTGDIVSYDLGSQLGVTGAFRIRKQTISAAPTGQEAVDLEFV